MNDMELIGGRDIQDLLGVSRQRAHVIVKRPDFPAPHSTVNNGRTKLWARHDVLTWIDTHRYDITPPPPP